MPIFSILCHASFFYSLYITFIVSSDAHEESSQVLQLSSITSGAADTRAEMPFKMPELSE